MSNWQGGTRGIAMVAGGVVPVAMRGKKLEGFIAVEDWCVLSWEIVWHYLLV
jgi:hypothetical protein